MFQICHFEAREVYQIHSKFDLFIDFSLRQNDNSTKQIYLEKCLLILNHLHNNYFLFSIFYLNEIHASD